jgi:hypothetical protein
MFCVNCGGKNVDGAATCVTCGKALVQPVGTLQRSGNELVVSRGAVLPAYCVKCGQASDGTIKRNFSWHPAWVYVLAVSPIIYIIVALIISKRMALEVPLCSTHRGQRKTRMMIGLGLLLGCIPLGIAIGASGSGDDLVGVGFLVGFAAFIAGCVVLIMSRVMSAKEINEGGGRFGGISPAFLDVATRQAQATGAGR